MEKYTILEVVADNTPKQAHYYYVVAKPNTKEETFKTLKEFREISPEKRYQIESVECAKGIQNLIGAEYLEEKMYTRQKFDYSENAEEDIFYKIIYPLYAREFLYGNHVRNFVNLVSSNFTPSVKQWQFILRHWDEKENILKNIP